MVGGHILAHVRALPLARHPVGGRIGWAGAAESARAGARGSACALQKARSRRGARGGAGQLQLLASLNSSFRQCSATPAASLELCGRGRTRAMVPSGGIGARTRPARQWPSQSGWREAPMASLQSGRGPAVRNTIAAPVGALDADCRAWREGPQSRGRWSTPRRARAAGAAQQARCMSGRSIAFRRPLRTWLKEPDPILRRRDGGWGVSRALFHGVERLYIALHRTHIVPRRM